MSAYATEERSASGAFLAVAAALVIACGSALVATQRSEIRLARQRATRYPRRHEIG